MSTIRKEISNHYVLQNVGEIYNLNCCLNVIKKLNPSKYSKVDFYELLSRIEENNKSDVKYYNLKNGKLYQSTIDDSNVLLFNTGFKSYDGDSIYFQFTRGSLGDFIGCFCGTFRMIRDLNGGASPEDISLLTRKIGLGELDKSDEIKEKRSLGYQSFLDELSCYLLKPACWNSTSNLDMYLNMVIARLNSLLKKGADVSNFLVFNSDNSYAYFKTALLNKFGDNIGLVSKVWSKDELSFTNLFLIKNKLALKSFGFAEGALNVELSCVRFFSDLSELYVDFSMDDFDLLNYDNLVHIVVERRDRYPDEFKNVPSDFLCSDLIKAVGRGIEINKANPLYIKPFYNRRYDEIQFIIPYHLGVSIAENPNMGIVITRIGDFWYIKTVLPIEECIKCTSSMLLYNSIPF